MKYQKREDGAEIAVERTDGVQLKKVIIARRPGFRDGIPFRFAGQLFEPMTDDEAELQAQGEFEPEAVTEFFEDVLTIPPLNFALLKQHSKLIGRITGGGDEESFQAIVDVTLHALGRNYRGIPRWLVEESLDMANMPEFVGSFMDMSGLKRKAYEEKKAAAAASSTLTGTGSAAP